MGISINKTALKSPNGILKIVALVLTIVVLALARAGGTFVTSANSPIALYGYDQDWLLHATTVGATITLCILIVTYLLGDVLPLKTEAMFVLMYAVMFIAAGACTIQKFQNNQKSTPRDKALAMGSMAIITGIVMCIDFALLVKAILKK